MSFPAIKEKILQLPRSRKILLLFLVFLIFIIVGEGFYYFLVYKNRDKKLRIEKKGIYTLLTSEEGSRDRFVSGIIKQIGVSDGLTLLELEVEGSNNKLKVYVPSDAVVYSWTDNGIMVRRVDRSKLIMGLKILISRIFENDDKEVVAKRVTILQ